MPLLEFLFILHYSHSCSRPKWSFWVSFDLKIACCFLVCGLSYWLEGFSVDKQHSWNHAFWCCFYFTLVRSFFFLFFFFSDFDDALIVIINYKGLINSYLVQAFADAYSTLENELICLPSSDDLNALPPCKLLPKIIPSIDHVVDPCTSSWTVCWLKSRILDSAVCLPYNSEIQLR